MASRLSSCPWYCAGCQIKLAGSRDITLDMVLLRYLCDSVLPDDDQTRERILAASSFVSWTDSRLWIRSDQLSNKVQIPPIRLRPQIIEALAQATGVPSGDRLYQLLRQAYWWRGMRLACMRYAQCNLAL